MKQENTILMCQIESPEGVEHIQEIIGVEGIDAAFVGPNDLSQNYGVLGEYDNPVMEQAYDKILKAAQTAWENCRDSLWKKRTFTSLYSGGLSNEYVRK